MIYVLDANRLPGLSDADKKTLSLPGTDKILILCDTNTVVSIDIMQFFMEMKAKTEFVQLTCADDGFELGYQCGVLVAKNEGEKVVVVSDLEPQMVLPANVSFVKSISPTKKISTSGFRSRSRSVAKKTEKSDQQVGTTNEDDGRDRHCDVTECADSIPDTVIEKKSVRQRKKSDSQKPQTQDVTESVNNDIIPDSSSMMSDEPINDIVPEQKVSVSKRKAVAKDLPAESLTKAYPELKPFAGKIASLHDLFVDAIRKATDAEVSLKLQLHMVFADDGDVMWSIIKKDYDKLKKLVV